MRSWLLVPAGNPARLGKAADLGADAVVIDFHGAGAEHTPEHTQETRTAAAGWLASHRGNAQGFARWIRIRPVTAPQWGEDLAAAMVGAPDGIVMTGIESVEEVRRLASDLYEIEQRHGIAPTSTRLLLEVGGTARGALAIRAFAQEPQARLAGFATDLAGLAADLDTAPPPWATLPTALATTNAETLLVAKSLGMLAIAGADGEWRDLELFETRCRTARSEGFEGMMAVHPAQIAPINRVFSPTPAERDRARDICDRFDSTPGANMIYYHGRMVDRNQLARERRRLG